MRRITLIISIIIITLGSFFALKSKTPIITTLISSPKSQLEYSQAKLLDDLSTSAAASSSSTVQPNVEYYCDGLYIAQSAVYYKRQSFIINHAMNMFYNGEDKDNIINTLAHDYDLETAINFINYTQSVSQFNENFELKKASIAAVILGNKISNELEAYEKTNWFFDHTASQELQLTAYISEQLGLFPDISTGILLSGLFQAIKNSDSKAFKIFIGQLFTTHYHPLESYLVTKYIFQSLMEQPLPQPFKASLSKQLSELKIIYFANIVPSAIDIGEIDFNGQSISRLKALSYNFDNIEMIDINNMTFTNNETLSEQFRHLLANSPELSKPINPKSWCDENEKSKEVYKKKRTILSKQTSPLSAAHHTEFSSFCASIANIVMVNDFFNHQGWKRSEVFSLKHMATDTFKKQIAVIKEKLPNKLNIVFPFSSRAADHKNQQRFDQLSILIKHDLFPKNSDIAKAFQGLSIEQSFTLLKEAGAIEQSNAHGETMVFNAIRFSNFPFALELIKRGYPLKVIEDSPDPFHLYLLRLTIQNSLSENNLQLLDALIDQTHSITSDHRNTIKRIKIKNVKVFSKITERHPQLGLNLPEYLTEYQCGGASILI